MSGNVNGSSQGQSSRPAFVKYQQVKKKEALRSPLSCPFLCRVSESAIVRNHCCSKAKILFYFLHNVKKSHNQGLHGFPHVHRHYRHVTNHTVTTVLTGIFWRCYFVIDFR